MARCDPMARLVLFEVPRDITEKQLDAFCKSVQWHSGIRALILAPGVNANGGPDAPQVSVVNGRVLNSDQAEAIRAAAGAFIDLVGSEAPEVTGHLLSALETLGWEAKPWE